MINYKKIKNVLFVLSLIISVHTFAQQKLKTSENWNLIKEQNGVNFYSRLSECDMIEGQKKLVYSFLKIENTTNQALSISFDHVLAFKEGCDGCVPNPECAVAVNIPANAALEADCNINGHVLSRIVANPNLLGGWSFEKTLIKNLQIK
ncbi:MAG: hypothetical protein RIT10_1468 [Bacteroidota bacterium]|jgi:hypothetical protein